MNAGIEVSNLTKTYGAGDAAYQALRGVDFAVAPGEFVMRPLGEPLEWADHEG